MAKVIPHTVPQPVPESAAYDNALPAPRPPLDPAAHDITRPVPPLDPAAHDDARPAPRPQLDPAAYDITQPGHGSRAGWILSTVVVAGAAWAVGWVAGVSWAWRATTPYYLRRHRRIA